MRQELTPAKKTLDAVHMDYMRISKVTSPKSTVHRLMKRHGWKKMKSENGPEHYQQESVADSCYGFSFRPRNLKIAGYGNKEPNIAIERGMPLKYSLRLVNQIYEYENKNRRQS